MAQLQIPIPDELFEAFKGKCQKDGIFLKKAVEEALRRWLNGEVREGDTGESKVYSPP